MFLTSTSRLWGLRSWWSRPLGLELSQLRAKQVRTRRSNQNYWVPRLFRSVLLSTPQSFASLVYRGNVHLCLFGLVVLRLVCLEWVSDRSSPYLHAILQTI